MKQQTNDEVERWKTYIENMAERNADGNGLIVHYSNQTSFYRGLPVPELIDRATRAMVAGAHAVIHCRIKTSGTRGAEMTHPFLISATRQIDTRTGRLAKTELLLVHNGIMRGGNAELSDTAELALGLRPAAAALAESPETLISLLDRMAGNNKFAVCTTSGIWYTGGFERDKHDLGIFSNSSYEPPTRWQTEFGGYRKAQDNRWRASDAGVWEFCPQQARNGFVRHNDDNESARIQAEHADLFE